MSGKISELAAAAALSGAELVEVSQDDGGLGSRKTTAQAIADLSASPVQSVNTQTGAVVIGAGDVGADPAGTAASEVGAIPSDGTAATPTLRTLGTGATQAAAGNDARLTDERTPTDGSVTEAKLSGMLSGTADDLVALDGAGDFKTVASGAYVAPGDLGTTTVVAASGATQTLTMAAAGYDAIYVVTMDVDCAFGFAGAVSGTAYSVTLVLSGAFTPTFAAAVVWADGTPPSYGTPAVFEFLTTDGGTTIFGFAAGKAFA